LICNNLSSNADRRQSDRRPSGVRLAHEEAPAPGRQADRGRSPPHRSGAHAARGSRASSAPAARHQCRGAHGARPCGRHRRPGRRGFRARAVRLGRIPGLGGVRLRAAQQPRGGGADLRRSGGDDPRRRPPLRHRGKQRDLLRPRRHRAQPGLDHGDRHRQPRHGDRQHRASRRRREPVARAEQFARRVRHRLVPPRALRLPSYFRRGDPLDVRDAVGGRSRQRARPAHPQHAGRRARRLVQGHLHPGRGHSAVRPRHPARRGGPCRDGMRRRAGPVSERDRELRPRLSARLHVPRKGRHLHQCGAAHPARAAGDAVEVRQGGLGDHPRYRRGDGLCSITNIRRRSWTRSRA